MHCISNNFTATAIFNISAATDINRFQQIQQVASTVSDRGPVELSCVCIKCISVWMPAEVPVGDDNQETGSAQGGKPFSL